MVEIDCERTECKFNDDMQCTQKAITLVADRDQFDNSIAYCIDMEEE